MGSTADIPLMQNGDPAYWWRVDSAGQSQLYRGLTIETTDGKVKILAGEEGEIELPREDVWPTYIDAIEAGWDRGHKLPARKAPLVIPPQPMFHWVCSGCKATEQYNPWDIFVRVGPLAIRVNKCKTCRDEVLLQEKKEKGDEGVKPGPGSEAVRGEDGPGNHVAGE